MDGLTNDQRVMRFTSPRCGGREGFGDQRRRDITKKDGTAARRAAIIEVKLRRRFPNRRGGGEGNRRGGDEMDLLCFRSEWRDEFVESGALFAESSLLFLDVQEIKQKECDKTGKG